MLIEQTARTGIMFQLTAARRRLPVEVSIFTTVFTFQLTAARRRLPLALATLSENTTPVSRHVSTHSRPKAAATSAPSTWSKWQSFNSQPPEGGCGRAKNHPRRLQRFNSQPPEGGCTVVRTISTAQSMFQLTAARRRLRGVSEWLPGDAGVSTHSRPKAAAGAG